MIYASVKCSPTSYICFLRVRHAVTHNWFQLIDDLFVSWIVCPVHGGCVLAAAAQGSNPTCALCYMSALRPILFPVVSPSCLINK